MTVLLRSLWTDSRVENTSEIIDAVRLAFSRWALGDADADGLPDGEHRCGGRTLNLTASGTEPAFLSATRSDITTNGCGNGVQWTTELRVVGNGDISVLVENSVRTSNPRYRYEPASPALIHALLALTPEPRTPDGHRLHLEPVDVTAAGVADLVDLLQDESRVLPAVVCSEKRCDGGKSARIAAAIARRTRGLANVFLLDDAAADELKALLPGLAIWGGAARTYLPGAVGGRRDAWRHRYVPYEALIDGGVDRIAAAVAALSTRTPAPARFLMFEGTPARLTHRRLSEARDAAVAHSAPITFPESPESPRAIPKPSDVFGPKRGVAPAAKPSMEPADEIVEAAETSGTDALDDTLRDADDPATQNVAEAVADAISATAAEVRASVLADMDTELAALIDDIEAKDAALAELHDENGSLTSQLAEAQGHLSRVRALMDSMNLSEAFWAAHDATPCGIPDEVADASEAVLAAQTYLSDWVTIPDDAARDLANGIDIAPQAFSWGNSILRGLRSLATFAQERASGYAGDFWMWCRDSGSPMAWPASSKKLAMQESETTISREKWRLARTFTIDPAVDPAGSVMMVAHLKITNSGGDISPRVYFYDDCDGPTRKIHVGFVGPHYLVPNPRS